MDHELSEEELQDLYAWIDNIPLSRPKKHITRDFSDGGVMAAEVVKHFFPKMVELHNYSPANSTQQKMSNWSILNRQEMGGRCFLSSALTSVRTPSRRSRSGPQA
ncbi:hypothetical protein CRUP_004730 [Coryphaenoides rupestris]|nr:hypothetical protein CRUP_004730 [Coryphaenoides rupestris]